MLSAYYADSSMVIYSSDKKLNTMSSHVQYSDLHEPTNVTCKREDGIYAMTSHMQYADDQQVIN